MHFEMHREWDIFIYHLIISVNWALLKYFLSYLKTDRYCILYIHENLKQKFRSGNDERIPYENGIDISNEY